MKVYEVVGLVLATVSVILNLVQIVVARIRRSASETRIGSLKSSLTADVTALRWIAKKSCGATTKPGVVHDELFRSIEARAEQAAEHSSNLLGEIGVGR